MLSVPSIDPRPAIRMRELTMFLWKILTDCTLATASAVRRRHPPTWPGVQFNCSTWLHGQVDLQESTNLHQKFALTRTHMQME